MENLHWNRLNDAPKCGEIPRYSHSALTILRPGVQAPDFCLPIDSERICRLKDFLGRPIVLVFYPSDWSPVCGDQLALYDALLSDLKKHKATVLAISTDNPWSHKAYRGDRKLNFPLLSDFDPRGATAKKYGVYDLELGLCERALFLIHPDGKVDWSYVAPVGVSPGADELLQALEELHLGKAWRA